MRKRRKKQLRREEGWRMLPWRANALLEFTTVEELEASDIEGAYVKLSPALEPHEARVFDAAAITSAAEARGAVAVLISPRILPSSASAVKEDVADMTRWEAIEAWFTRQQVEAKRKKHAKALVEDFLARAE